MVLPLAEVENGVIPHGAIVAQHDTLGKMAVAAFRRPGFGIK